jgi:carbon monoxide dehydrogenase subunit G
MASIRREIVTKARPDDVWAALRDIGALHTRLVPGFVKDTQVEGESRIVTFSNGMVVRELIVDVNDEQRRVVWSAVGGALTHHNGSAQVFPEDGGKSRVVWIADLLPHEMAGPISSLMDEGMKAMKAALDQLV